MRCDNLPNYYANSFGNLHGAAMVTWLDDLTCNAVAAFSNQPNETVSLNMQANYLNKISINDTPLFFKLIVRKIGKTVGFAEMQILSKDGEIIAKMAHNLAFTNLMGWELKF